MTSDDLTDPRGQAAAPVDGVNDHHSWRPMLATVGKTVSVIVAAATIAASAWWGLHGHGDALSDRVTVVEQRVNGLDGDKASFARQDVMSERFDRMDKQFDAVQRQFDAVMRELDAIQKKLDK